MLSQKKTIDGFVTDPIYLNTTCVVLLTQVILLFSFC